MSMVASGVWAGEISIERAHELQEVSGDKRTMQQELQRIGYLGDKNAHHEAMPIEVGFDFPLVLAKDFAC